MLNWCILLVHLTIRVETLGGKNLLVVNVVGGWENIWSIFRLVFLIWWQLVLCFINLVLAMLSPWINIYSCSVTSFATCWKLLLISYSSITNCRHSFFVRRWIALGFSCSVHTNSRHCFVCPTNKKRFPSICCTTIIFRLSQSTRSERFHKSYIVPCS